MSHFHRWERDGSLWRCDCGARCASDAPLVLLIRAAALPFAVLAGIGVVYALVRILGG